MLEVAQGNVLRGAEWVCDKVKRGRAGERWRGLGGRGVWSSSGQSPCVVEADPTALSDWQQPGPGSSSGSHVWEK